MGTSTEIAWCHHTFNPWTGCYKISKGCKNCYAAAHDARNLSGRNERSWGVLAPRPVASEMSWLLPATWARAAKRAGERRRVFCGSTCDVGEAREDLVIPRLRLVDTIEATPALDWLLLSKRWHETGGEFHWKAGRPPAWVWLGASVENQEEAHRVRVLKMKRAAVRFLSVEPLLEPVTLPLARETCPECLNLGQYRDDCQACERTGYLPAIDWVIVGGESGTSARRCAVEWIANVVEQCRDAHVACFVKQLGSKPFRRLDGAPLAVSKKGGDWREWPEEFPALFASGGGPLRELPASKGQALGTGGT